MSIIWSENNANVSSHKCDPSRDDYNRMASALLDAYPHVKGLLDTAEPWYVNSFKAGNVVCILLALYCGHVMYKVNYFVDFSRAPRADAKLTVILASTIDGDLKN